MHADKNSLTGQYLSGKKQIPVRKQRVPYNPLQVMELKDATGNNLKHVDLVIPVSLMTCITGVSGSGKSTLINDTLYQIVARDLNRANTMPAPYTNQFMDWNTLIRWLILIKVRLAVRHVPTRQPTQVYLHPIRELFAATAEARSRAYKPGRFSFNVKGGRCEACQGDGLIKVEMHFSA